MRPKLHRIAVLGATALTAAALAAPASGEPPASDGRFAPADTTVRSPSPGTLPDGFRSADSADPTRTRPVPSQQPLVVVESESTFQWGDAAIGAATTLGLILVAVGGSLVLRRSKHGHGAQMVG